MATATHASSRSESCRPTRPSFNSSVTADRLRECERRPSSSSLSNLRPRRSVFREERLDDLSSSIHDRELAYLLGPETKESTARSTKSEDSSRSSDSQKNGRASSATSTWYSRLLKPSRPVLSGGANATLRTTSFVSMSRLALITLLVAVVIPGFRNSGKESIEFSGADAGVIPNAALVENAATIEGRANSPTAVCTRWAQQVAIVNGTVYIYGGQAKLKSGQTQDTWNNDFLTLDLTKSWSIATPPLTGLPQPSGPPPVALGALWNSYEELWVYGGEFSDSPPNSPLPVSLWEYNIKNAEWTEQANPQTAAGNNSDGGNTAVQRAAEGASLSVPELGKSWYFGGHLDLYTTEGWSNQIARVYLRSLLEFTHPGYANTGVDSLGSTTAAGADGVFRNITSGGLQAEAGFTERADGVLVYIPGWGDEGIVLGLAGGTNTTFTEMNIIDIYDIANSNWYKQPTSGPSPPIRVNPCAVVAAAPDGTSFNVYLYGGQNLIPFGEQIQYSDMWILTIPSFTWIQVDMDGQSQPPARAGHSCVLWDAQMVVIGGYVGTQISCDPGFYVFNTSSLQWTNSFTALSSTTTDDQGSSIIQGSTGYQVPAAVQSIIGGSSAGGATATTPAAGNPTVGPIGTGKPPTYTITQSGSTIIQTAHSTSTVKPTATPSLGSDPSTKSATNIGAIVAGAFAGALALLAGYLAFCTYLYRRQLDLYKNHVAMAQRTGFANSPRTSSTKPNEKLAPGPAALLGPFGTQISPMTSRPSDSSNPGITDSSGPTPGSGPDDTDVRAMSNVPSKVPGKVHSNDDRYGEYGRLSDTDNHPDVSGGRPSSVHSSMEDLLGGQEPSFFSVVLNPRRTLRVVNMD